MTTENRLCLGAGRIWAALIAAIVLSLLAGGYAFYRVETQRIRLDKYNELAAIGQLKAGQIADWRRERLNNANNAVESPFFRKGVEAWLKDSGNLVLRDELLQCLKIEQETELHSEVLLLDLDGRILLAASDDIDPVGAATTKAVAQVLEGKRTVLSDLFRSSGHVHLDAVAPVSDANNKIVAFVILRSNATEFLYPLIQSWPIPSRSAETFLFQKEGDGILYLNELRHQAGAALSFRLPLNRTDLPAVQAAAGKQGMFEGKDYRGVKVLADLRPISGSSWFMVAKMDSFEILAEARYRGVVIAVFVVLFILLAAAVVAFSYRQRQARLYRELYCSEREKYKAQELLRESEERHRSLLQTTMNGFLLVDTQGRLLEANETYCRMSGYSAQELLAMRITDLEADETDNDTAAHIHKIMAQGEDRFEARHRRKDGTYFYVEVSVQYRPVEDGRFVGSLQDITERKRAEEENARLEGQLQQAQKMESVGRLAGGVAHDFNNMLGVILGHAEIALDQMDPMQPVYADLEEIRKAAERSADLTRQLLAFARKQTVAPKVLDLNEVVAGMHKMLQRLLGEDIALAWQPKTDLWPVKVDPSQIDQILANLCVNARDAIADVGKVTIEMGNSTLDADYCADHAGFAPGEYVWLSVIDNGCGMDKVTLAHIFEPFFTTKEMGKGTGLGLATVYGAVKQNHGFIDAYSEPGQGMTFTIYLPRHVGKAEQARTKGASEPAMRGQETILLVEDEPSILNLCRIMLERLGYKVLSAITPGEALRLAETHAGEIHLLMTDVVMPEMNGRDLAKNLLALYPRLKRLFMSGYTANVIAHHGVLDEGVCFIQKPFSREELAVRIREALSGE